MLSINRQSINLKKTHKGVTFELSFSEIFHKEGVPLLISPKLLRKRGCGQIDLSIVRKNKIVAAECKLGDHGPSFIQKQRLLNSCRFLLLLFSFPVDLITVKRFAKSFDSAYPFNRNKIGELR